MTDVVKATTFLSGAFAVAVGLAEGSREVIEDSGRHEAGVALMQGLFSMVSTLQYLNELGETLAVGDTSVLRSFAASIAWANGTALPCCQHTAQHGHTA